MVFDESLFLLRQHIRDLLQSGIRRFVIDVSDVPYLDSSACGEVLGAYSSIMKSGGTLVFVNPSERVRVLWSRIKVTEILRSFATLDEALAVVRSAQSSSQTN